MQLDYQEVGGSEGLNRACLAFILGGELWVLSSKAGPLGLTKAYGSCVAQAQGFRRGWASFCQCAGASEWLLPVRALLENVVRAVVRRRGLVVIGGGILRSFFLPPPPPPPPAPSADSGTWIRGLLGIRAESSSLDS